MPATLEAPQVSTTTPVAPASPPINPMEEAFTRMKDFTSDDAKIAEPKEPYKSTSKTPSKAIAPVKETTPEKIEPPKQESAHQETEDDFEEQEQPKQQKVEESKEAEAKAEVTEKGKKISPWKLVDQYKSKVTDLEKQVADLKTNPPEDPEKKTLSEKLSDYEKRVKEYEDHIRFVDYQKHPEFLEKYDKPYEDSWKKAVSNLKGLKVTVAGRDGQAETRDLLPQDLASLANMEPVQARAIIKEMFPDDAEEVKMHIKDIRDRAELRQQALDQAKKSAETRQQQMAEASKKAQEETMQIWQKLNVEAQQKWDVIKPVDGDAERNEKITKATALVDKAFGANPNDPKLTPEQRAQIIKSHIGLRNRAIGYSVLRHENSSLKARVAELEESLKAYEGSEPTKGDGKSQSATAPPQATTLDAVVGSLAGYAKG